MCLKEYFAKSQEWVKFITIHLDVRTRWNSCYDMIDMLIANFNQIRSFVDLLRVDKNSKKIYDPKNKIPEINLMDWAIISGMRILLFGFKHVTEVLSGEKYPTFVLAYKMLNQLRSILKCELLFNPQFTFHDMESKWDECPHMVRSNVMAFYKNFHEIPDFAETIGHLSRARKGLLKRLDDRCAKLDWNFAWTTLLHPKHYSANTIYVNEEKFAQLRDEFKLQVKEIVKQHVRTIPDIDSFLNKKFNIVFNESPNGNGPTSTPPRTNYDNFTVSSTPRKNLLQAFDTSTPIALKQNNENCRSPKSKEEKLEIACNELVKDECKRYFSRPIPVETNMQDPLTWWEHAKRDFPFISELARNWLCCPATSTPSERLFSACGIVDTPRRNRLRGLTMQDLMMINRNLKKLEIPDEVLIAKYFTPNM